MKSPAIIFVLLLLIFPLFSNANVTIFGKINGSTDEMVNIMVSSDEPLQGKIIYRARLNENNEFLMDLPVRGSQFIEMKVGEKSFDIFVGSTTDRIEFEAEAHAPEQTIRFKGRHISNNSFYNSFKRSFQWNLDKKEKYEVGGLTTLIDANIKNKTLTYSKEDYFRILETDHQSQLKYLHNTPSLNRDFFRMLENEIHWKYETNKFAYFLFNKDRFTTHDLQRFWVRYALLRNADINDERYIKSPTFQNLLNSFIHFLHLQTPVTDKVEEAYFTFIRKNLRNQPMYFMLAKLMVNNYQIGNSKLAMQEFKSFKRTNPYPVYNQTLEEIFGKNGQYLTAQNAPDFKVLDLYEREIYLTNFSGKVVYVSFWASWCAPCLKGFRETKDLRTQLKNSGVVFLNVNVDEREDIWRNVLARENIVGENVYGLDLKKAKEVLKISALPHYVIVNKFGKIECLSSDKLTECYDDFMKLLVE